MKPVFAHGQAGTQAGDLRRGRGRARAARGAGGGRREAGQADPDRAPRSGRDAHQSASACACARARTSSWSIRRAIRATGTCGPSTTGIMRRRGVSPDDARTHVRQSTTLIGAMLLRRGDGDALLCGTFGRHKDHLRHIANVIGLETGAANLRGDERADAAQAHAVHLRHLRQRGSDGRAAGRDHGDGRRGGAPLRHHAQGGVAVAFELRHRRLALGAEDEPRAAS